jgi:hypothetical protein
MKKFTRQTSGNAPTAVVNLDFAAASAKVARLFEPGEYRLRIDSALIIQNNQNISVLLNLIEMEGGGRVGIRPLWVDGPNAGAGDLADKNRDLIRQLLILRELPTAGNVNDLIPQLAGLEFDARLVLAPDRGTGQIYNALADIYKDDGP